MSARSTPKVKRPALKRDASMAENVFVRLVEALVTGELPAGGPLREAQVAKQWGVSRELIASVPGIWKRPMSVGNARATWPSAGRLGVVMQTTVH